MVIYNKEEAKKQVLETLANLKALQSKLGEALTLGEEAVTAESFNSFVAVYETFPITYQIDWAVADLDPADAQVIADDVRSQLQQMTGVIGINKFIPRLFMGNKTE